MTSPRDNIGSYLHLSLHPRSSREVLVITLSRRPFADINAQRPIRCSLSIFVKSETGVQGQSHGK